MRRALVIGSVLAVLVACGLAAWAAPSALVAPMILPDASNVVERWRGLGATEVRYQTTGAPLERRGQLSDQLARAGWTGHSYPNIGASHPPFSSIWFTRETRLGPFVLTERVIFDDTQPSPTTVTLLLDRKLR